MARARYVNYQKLNLWLADDARKLIPTWLPGGQIKGNRYFVRNPMRPDKRPGSFVCDLKSGYCKDFATGQSWSSLRLYAALHRLETYRAAITLIEAFGWHHCYENNTGGSMT